MAVARVVRVRPMSDDEFDRFRGATIADYAGAKVASGQWNADTAVLRAAANLADRLPEGLHTPGVLLLSGECDGEVIGWLWIGPHPDGRRDTAWVYYIEVLAAARGRGLGRALLECGEQAAATAGFAALGLNVFGFNAVARSLYESSGYSVDSVQMHKPLGPTSPDPA